MRKRVRVLVPVLIVIAVIVIFTYKGIQNKKVENINENILQDDVTVLEVTVADLEELKSSGVPAMIDFGAKSCGPCREMALALETLHKEWQGKAVVHFMDVWNSNQGLEDFPLQVIPTQFYFDKDGIPFVPSEELQEEMEFIMYQEKETGIHVLTAHQGVVTEEQLRRIFGEMGVE